MSGDGPSFTEVGAQPDASYDTKNVAWYIADGDLPKLDPQAHGIFVKYSHLPPDAVPAHVLKKVSHRQGTLCYGCL